MARPDPKTADAEEDKVSEIFSQLSPKHVEFIEKQQIFFVGPALQVGLRFANPTYGFFKFEIFETR